ncbi:hypothetical protein MCOR25_000447 [Pyricularia grisea]|uniref:diacylglycerol O-acyltransferase n=1 Tax=Pyricularia grisea TaxID=148305 RepID=A0A6P8AV56_PYRGI|nr:uncharacterized protein PgNI_08842 [Pyricularia grisea]KAI6382938.1 hypothetical protein MCOR25_000447 [Pyricularia grisea]TLD06085.1 hypothetical protein PgNI_08842 [Pyricularia grisea]
MATIDDTQNHVQLNAESSPDAPPQQSSAGKEEYPSLPPAPLPDIDGSSENGHIAADAVPPPTESTEQPWNKVASGDFIHETKISSEDQVNLARPGSLPTPEPSRRGSNTLVGSPRQGEGLQLLMEEFADDESSDTSWDIQEAIRSRTQTLTEKNHQGIFSKQRRANQANTAGTVTSANAWLPAGFEDDLDEVTGADDEFEPTRGRRWRVRLAPLNTPIHRRMQTLVVLLHVLGMGITFSFFCFMCTLPLFWPIIITYLVFIRLSRAGSDGKTNRRVEWLRRARIWKYFADYFPVKLHKTADLPPTRKYIFAVHPHGIISHGAFASFATEALGFSDKFPGITNSLCTLHGNFKTPFYREYLMAMGLISVSKESIINTLMTGGTNGEGMGRAVSIIVGGAREALEACPKTMRLILKRRGFCRMALRTGADLVPVLCFGENDLYQQWGPQDHPRFRRLQMKALAYLGFAVPVLRGRGVFNYDFGVLPQRRPINVVVGEPIKVEQFRSGGNIEPRVEELWKLYCQKLQELYDQNKDVYFKDRKEEMRFVDSEEL